MKPHRLIIAIVLLVLLTGTSYVVITKVVPTVSRELRLSGLLPHVRAAFEALENDLLNNHHIRLHVGSTVRNETEQSKLVNSGNSATNHSWHLLRRAIDTYPIVEASGKPDINGTHLELYKTLHNVAPKYGFRGLAFNPDGTKRYITGKKGKVWDGGHLEYPDGMTWAQAAAKDKNIG